MKFSLVIPVAPERGAEIIESIKELDFPKNEFHVVIVRGLNPSENRNKGAKQSYGEIIGFLDDDAVVDKNLLKNAADFFDKHPEIDIVGGPQLTPPDDKTFAKISGYGLSSKFGAWKMANRYDGKKAQINADETMLTSANLFCRRKVMETIGFDPTLFPGEDPKFIADAQKKGFKVSYSPDLVIYHRRRATVKGLIKQIFSYGKFRPAKEPFFETIKMPFFLFPSILLVYLIALFTSVLIPHSITGNAVYFSDILNVKANYLVLFWFLPLIAYLILDAIFSIYESFKNKNITALFLLPFIFPLIHLSYGAGMIYGYIKRQNRIKETS